MSNKSTLVPQAHKLTVEEASKGGRASVESRREKKAMRETLEELLAMTHIDMMTGIESTKREAVAAALVERAISGDVSAARLIFGYTDGLPTIRAEVETAIPEETYERVRRVLEGDM